MTPRQRSGGAGQHSDARPQIRGGLDLPEVLHRLALTASHACRFGAVTVNILRPDGSTNVVADTDGELLGSTVPAAFWTALLRDEYRSGGSYLIVPEHTRRVVAAFPDVATVVPEISQAPEPDRWDPDHMLVVPMLGRDGAPVGYFSADCPSDGKVPNPELVADMETFARHAALTVQLEEEARALRESEAKLRMLAAQLPAHLWTTDTDLCVTSIEGTGLATTGLAPERYTGKGLRDLVATAGQGPEPIAAHVRALGGEANGYRIEVAGRLFEARVEPLRDGQGSIAGCVGVALDVTERRESEEALQASEERFRALVRNSTDVIVVLGADGVTRYISEAVERVLGYRPEERVGASVFEPGKIHPGDVEAVRAVFSQLVPNPEAELRAEFRLRHKDGTYRHVEAVGRNLLGDPSVDGVVVNYRDVTERKALEDRLRYQALHDPLTGLPNRVLLMDRLEHALARVAGRGGAVAVLYLDLDRLKRINDSLGHEAGDRLLQAVGDRLRACLRAEDTVARLSGDEFAAVLEDVADPAEPLRAAERILRELRLPFALAGPEVYASASIGVALSSSGVETPAALLRAADAAMYRAKAGGTARYEVYGPTTAPPVLRRLESEGELRRALERGEFAVHYQPKVEMDSGRIAEVEALVRWIHPERGMLPPAEFIGLAEETGLIVPIGRWVLEVACRQVRAWQRRYPDGALLRANVNLSARQFAHPDLAGDVSRALSGAGLEGRFLELEITESVVMGELEAVVATLEALKALGASLAIDDFGTGYSSLSYLKRFPVDTLKIDGGFVAGLGRDCADTAIVRAVVGLGRAVGLKIVAEGVETAEQLATLGALGCELAQGYYLCRPLPADGLEPLLAARRRLPIADA